MPFFFQFTRSGALMSDQKNAEANKIVYLTRINSDGGYGERIRTLPRFRYFNFAS